jgi:hypothetical protein
MEHVWLMEPGDSSVVKFLFLVNWEVVPVEDYALVRCSTCLQYTGEIMASTMILDEYC